MVVILAGVAVMVESLTLLQEANGVALRLDGYRCWRADLVVVIYDAGFEPVCLLRAREFVLTWLPTQTTAFAAAAQCPAIYYCSILAFAV